MNARLSTRLPCAAILAGLLAATAVRGTGWENPVFEDADAAVRAGLEALSATTPDELGPRELFSLFTVSSRERPDDPRFADVRRQVKGSFLLTLPSYLEDDRRARGTLESFLAEVAGERADLGETLGRFGFPPLPGLVYLKLVKNVAELQRPGRPEAEREVQIGGVTYYCRYVVIPLSYITPESLEELRGAALDPGVDVEATLRQWERDSFRVMLATLRHELVHVWTNSSLGPPRYRNRELYPTWFLEGSASFLAADPHSGLSESYKGYQNLFFYLVERHGVNALRAFFGRILAGASVRESLEETYDIAGSGELRAREGRWRGRKETVSGVLAIALLAVVLLALLSHRLPVFGSLQLWLAVTLAYSTFSGFCASSQALNGATAVLVQQLVFGAGALVFAARGVRSIRRFSRRAAA